MGSCGSHLEYSSILKGIEKVMYVESEMRLRNLHRQAASLRDVCKHETAIKLMFRGKECPGEGKAGNGFPRQEL